MKAKMVNFVVNPENVTESLKLLTRAVSSNADVLSGALKPNKRLTVAVITLGVCVYIISAEQRLAYKRIVALEHEIEALKQKTEDEPAGE